jgi:hypothetical protein
MHLRQKLMSDRQNGARVENLRHGRTVASAREHYCDGALMLAATGILMEQLVKLGGSSENDDNQQVGHEQAGECVLPRFGVSKPLHFHPFKALYRPSQNDCCENNPPLFNEGVRKGLLQRLAVGCGYCLHLRRPLGDRVNYRVAQKSAGVTAICSG